MKKLPVPWEEGRRALLLLSFLLISGLALAQSVDEGRVAPDSARGFWKVQTDYNSRRTTIRFFNAERALIYQENMPGKYVKLTRRNIRLFNEMLDRLTNSQLLGSQVRAHDLLASSQLSFAHYEAPEPRSHPDEEGADPLLENSKTFRALPVVSNGGRLRITFANPEQRRVLIELTNDTGDIRYYMELSRRLTYNRHLNITQLTNGTYRLKMRGPKQQLFLYQLTINNTTRRYNLKPIAEPAW